MITTPLTIAPVMHPVPRPPPLAAPGFWMISPKTVEEGEEEEVRGMVVSTGGVVGGVVGSVVGGVVVGGTVVTKPSVEGSTK